LYAWSKLGNMLKFLMKVLVKKPNGRRLLSTTLCEILGSDSSEFVPMYQTTQYHISKHCNINYGLKLLGLRNNALIIIKRNCFSSLKVDCTVWVQLQNYWAYSPLLQSNLHRMWYSVFLGIFNCLQIKSTHYLCGTANPQWDSRAQLLVSDFTQVSLSFVVCSWSPKKMADTDLLGLAIFSMNQVLWKFIYIFF
jgi:hypothetical protein